MKAITVYLKLMFALCRLLVVRITYAHQDIQKTCGMVGVVVAVGVVGGNVGVMTALILSCGVLVFLHRCHWTLDSLWLNQMCLTGCVLEPLVRRLLAAAFQVGRCGIPCRSFLVLHTAARQFCMCERPASFALAPAQGNTFKDRSGNCVNNEQRVLAGIS